MPAPSVAPAAGPVVSDAPWVENRATAGRRALDVRELWEFRELTWFLASRDVRVRYKQAALGLCWAILQPLAGAAVLTLVFQRFTNVSSGTASYQSFAFCGLAVWTYYSTSLNSVTASLVTNSSLVTKVYFPRLSVPLSALLPGLIDLGVALTVLVVAVLIFGQLPGIAVLTLPLWTVALVFATVGPGLLLATLNVRYRDVHHAFGLLIQLLFFASPVAYPSTVVDGGWRYVYALNPVSTVLDGFRWALLRAPAPGLPAVVSAAVAAVLAWAGLRYFVAAERRFSDII